MREVHPNLVRTTGNRPRFDEGAAAGSADYFEMCLSRLPMPRIDFHSLW